MSRAAILWHPGIKLRDGSDVREVLWIAKEANREGKRGEAERIRIEVMNDTGFSPCEACRSEPIVNQNVIMRKPGGGFIPVPAAKCECGMNLPEL